MEGEPMRSQRRTWLISVVALGAMGIGNARWPAARTQERLPGPARRHRSKAPRSPSPWAPSHQPRPAPRRRRRRAGDQRQHLRDLLTRTPTASCPRPGDRSADAGRRHHVGVHAQRGHHVPQRRAVQRRRRSDGQPHGRPGRARRDRQRRVLRHLVGAEAVDEYTVRIMTDGPDGVLPARMYWLKQIPASAEETPTCRTSRSAPVRPLREPQPGCRHPIVANEEYWAKAARSPGHLEFSDDARHASPG